MMQNTRTPATESFEQMVRCVVDKLNNERGSHTLLWGMEEVLPYSHALKAELEKGSQEAVAWLIEYSGELPSGERGQIKWLYVQAKPGGFGEQELGFTTDANDAIWFMRKDDAEAVLQMYLGVNPPNWYQHPYSVTEHQFLGRPNLPPAEKVELERLRLEVAGLIAGQDILTNEKDLYKESAENWKVNCEHWQAELPYLRQKVVNNITRYAVTVGFGCFAVGSLIIASHDHWQYFVLIVLSPIVGLLCAVAGSGEHLD